MDHKYGEIVVEDDQGEQEETITDLRNEDKTYTASFTAVEETPLGQARVVEDEVKANAKTLKQNGVKFELGKIEETDATDESKTEAQVQSIDFKVFSVDQGRFPQTVIRSQFLQSFKICKCIASIILNFNWH